VTESRKWLRAALICVAGGCAYGIGLRGNHATTSQAIIGGALIAAISLTGIILIVLFVRLIVQFRQRNYRFSLAALLILVTLVVVVLGLIAWFGS
jgi:hypothetical protein